MTKSREWMELCNYMLFHFDWNLTYQVLFLYILRSHHLTWETSLEDAHSLVQNRHLCLQAFCKIILDVRIGAQQGISQGRRGFLEYGHFDKRFMYDMEKNCPKAGNCDHESLLQVEIPSSPAMLEECAPPHWLDSNGKPSEQCLLKSLYQFVNLIEAYPYAYP